MTKIDAINPWSWQEPLHFAHGVDTRGVERVLYCAGQTSVDADGQLLHPGDMTAQLSRAFDNLESVLARAGLSLANVVRLNYYVTDMARYGEARHIVAQRLGHLAVKPAGILVEITRLANPDAMVEIEATAAA